MCPPARVMMASIVFGMLANVTPSVGQENTRNGALMGGAAGAVIGGIIGNNKNDQTAEGALIGGAVGAVTGGLIGHHRDKVVAEQQRQAAARYHSSRAYPPPRYPYSPNPSYHPRYMGPGQPTIVYSAPVVTRHGMYRPPSRSMPVPARQPVTISDVIHLTRSGVSDSVIVSRIQANGMAQAPSVDDVIVLSQQGVSDDVIAAMQGDYRVSEPMESIAPIEINANPPAPDGSLMPVPPLRNQRRGF